MNEKQALEPVLYLPSDKRFGDIDEDYSNFKKSKVVIVQVPYEKTTTYVKGTKAGPAAIIEASGNMELFDDELNQEAYKIGIHTVEIPGIADAEPEDMVKKVHDATDDLLKLGKFPVILGGEHSVSVGAVGAMKKSYPDVSVLQLDAHYDLRDEYLGSKYNHACAARRISEICPLVQAGLRSLSKEEKDFLNTKSKGNIKTVNVYDILEKPLWKDYVINGLSENVYITIDLDVFDPSLMPAVGTPEPGGIGWYELIDLLKETAKDKKIVGFDVVELCPIENHIMSNFLAAKLVYRLLGYIFMMNSKK
ncbi:MAG: agmatinase [Candidatus Omnitrophota bacterium]